MIATYLDKTSLSAYKKHFGPIPDIDAEAVKSPYRYSAVRIPNKFSNSGFPGVTKRTDTVFEAAITIDNKRTVLGSFSSPQLANKAIQSALRTLRKGFSK